MVQVAVKVEAETAKKEVMDVDGNKENIPAEVHYAAPKVQEGRETGGEEMVD
jgi:hypothetical protein